MTGQLAYDPVRYASADGRLELFARNYPPAAGGAAKIPLLMMHGLTRNSADFDPLISALASGRRMIVPDQRGRGLSQYDSDPAQYRPDVYADDMCALLDMYGIERTVCIGTSMGGLISMVMGAQAPERIAGIVLNDVGPEVSEAGLDRIRNYVGGDEPMTNWNEAAARCAEINGDALDGLSGADWLAFARRTCREMPNGSIVFAYDPAISQGMGDADPATIPPDLWALWDAIAEIPITVIRGEKSDILSRETVAQMGQRHTGAFDHVEVPGRGHAPLLDEPVALLAIEDFLSSLG
ncbi:MAG: alpha/beta hydrolase [Pseudomonadota bacterium]